MKLSQIFAPGLLAVSVPLLLYASTLSSEVSCTQAMSPDQQQVIATPQARKPDFYFLYVLLAIGNSVAAYFLFRELVQQESRTEPLAIEGSDAPVVEVPAVEFKEPTPVVRSSNPAPVFSVQPEVSDRMEFTNGRSAQPVQAIQTAQEVQEVQEVQSAVQQPRKLEVTAEHLWFRDMLGYPGVLIYGAQGAGKTSFASFLLRCRIKKGHAVEVFDPHTAYGQWNGLKVVGRGMNYGAIDSAMRSFEGEVKEEYKKRSTLPDYSPNPKTILVEEFTNWSDRCKNSSELLKIALSDIRKIERYVVFVSHDRTLATLGGAKGVSGARDAGLVELELFAKVDETTGEAVPALKGRLKCPGKSPVEVTIAPWMRGGMDFTDLVQSESAKVQDLIDLNSAQSSEPKPNVPPDLGFSLFAKQQSEVHDDGSDFLGEDLSPNSDEEMLNRISELKAIGLNQDQIILAIWRAKKGGNKAYLAARDEYKRLTHE